MKNALRKIIALIGALCLIVTVAQACEYCQITASVPYDCAHGCTGFQYEPSLERCASTEDTLRCVDDGENYACIATLIDGDCVNGNCVNTQIVGQTSIPSRHCHSDDGCSG
jgi:hypothetical protein